MYTYFGIWSDTYFDKYSDIFCDILPDILSGTMCHSVIYLAAYLTNILNNILKYILTWLLAFFLTYRHMFRKVFCDISISWYSAVPIFYSYLTYILTSNLRFYRAYVLTFILVSMQYFIWDAMIWYFIWQYWIIFDNIWHMFWHCKSGFLSGILSVVFESGEVPSHHSISCAALFEWIRMDPFDLCIGGPHDLQPSGPSGLSADSHTWGCSSTSQVAASIPTGREITWSSNYSSPQLHPPKGRTHRQVIKGHCDLYSPRLSRLLLCWLLESVSLKAPFLPSIFCKECWMVRWIMLSSAGNCRWRLTLRPQLSWQSID